MKVIIYRNTDGSVGVIIPVQSIMNKYGIHAIAEKDVPTGLKYKIIDSDSLPDKTFRSAWELPENFDYDGVGNKSNLIEVE